MSEIPKMMDKHLMVIVNNHFHMHHLNDIAMDFDEDTAEDAVKEITAAIVSGDIPWDSMDHADVLGEFILDERVMETIYCEFCAVVEKGDFEYEEMMHTLFKWPDFVLYGTGGGVAHTESEYSAYFMRKRKLNDDLQNFFIASQNYWNNYPIEQDSIDSYWVGLYNDVFTEPVELHKTSKSFVTSCMRGSFYFMKEKYKISINMFNETVFAL
tara:strand:+ start:49 stop:684 length:636 start_codon:yes stop_codon:yes gene_type:complete